ncbi:MULTISPECIES: hypothetical protein [Rhizobium]|uniref:Uncharacterized protein n=1 Tax=Rhizobium bangladeshense TaxID=1138189 RepID=A0ABS7LIP7_9HYPH|nr:MULTISPECIES: hypothetical protein [Rhizobium]MBX4867265.1 hypothetical protein [Rhizobium bangladeshense]MBX4871556.1 hypothetical protein [Rhizobium bangladeshense]MBX4882870.1 hypothetical protein [Rhizobium bangladeshense]MBX4891260.1 hypothetical protein [Rhizobium bangladeshense]MBX4896961.1 hypothetical protein [Rhizobium bangladeshense]
MKDNKSAQTQLGGNEKQPAKVKEYPPAGPHAKKDLIDETKTPGAGSLPDEDERSVTPGSG